MSETFGDVVAYGSGTVEFRVRIEGCPLEFCTTHEMAGLRDGSGFDGPTVAGVRRVGGLLRSGLSFSESAYLPGADYKASVGSVTIEDTDDSVSWDKRAASSVFSRVPRVVGRLTATASATDTVLIVNDTSAFTIGSVYHLDTEAVRVDDADDNAIIVTRGMWGTTAQAHFVSTSTLVGDRTRYTPIFDAVPTYRRRRVWIYAHGPANIGAEDVGTLVARGVISGAPQLSEGTTWSFSIAPITTVLDEDVGPIEGAAVLRGIYYPGHAPLRLTFIRFATDEWLSGADGTATIVLSGFFETQAAFCDALNEKIVSNSTIAGWGVSISARPVDDRWGLFYRTAASPNQRYIGISGGTSVDGGIWPRDASLRIPGASPDLHVHTVGGATEYYWYWRDNSGSVGRVTPPEGRRREPRAQLFPYIDTLPDTAVQQALFPWWRAYVISTAGMSVGDVVRFDSKAYESSSEAVSWEAEITAVNVDEGYFEWDPDSMRRVRAEDSTVIGLPGPRGLGIETPATPALMPEITITRNYGTGSFADFIESVYTDAPDSANSGAMPFVLSSDFAPITEIRAAVEEAAMGKPWLLSRTYRFSSPVRLSDVIKHECRLAGLFMATTADGRITFRPLTTRTTSDATIGSEDILNDAGFGEIVTEPDGIVTGLTIRTGYDPREDEHTGQTHEITVLHALAIQRQRTALEIAPKSRPTGPEPSALELVAHLQAPIGMWSRQRAEVSLDVTVTYYDVLIGDAVFVTCPQLPYDGARSIDGGDGGMIGVRGTVVGRSWQLDEPAITLTILFDSLDVAGYTPAGRVTAQSGSGIAWTVTLDSDEYGPGGDVADASFFLPAMRVRLVEWDAASPAVVTGTVVSRSGNDVALELDSAWVPGSAIWNLHYAETTTSGFTDAQQRQALIARAEGRVHLASGTIATKEFAP